MDASVGVIGVVAIDSIRRFATMAFEAQSELLKRYTGDCTKDSDEPEDPEGAD